MSELDEILEQFRQKVLEEARAEVHKAVEQAKEERKPGKGTEEKELEKSA